MTEKTDLTNQWHESILNTFDQIYEIDNGSSSTSTTSSSSTTTTNNNNNNRSCMVVSLPSRRLVMLLRTISSQLPLPVPKKWQLTCKTRSGFLDDSIVKPIQAMSNHLTREEWFTCLSEIISLESEASDGGKTGDFITWESFNAGCLLYCKERKNELEARGGISSEGVNNRASD